MADLLMERITKSYGEVKALVGADFAADRGEIHALLGENGAGKSTLVRVLSRVVREDSGSVMLFGAPFVIRAPRQAIDAGIGTVYQELSLVPAFSVAENIFFGSTPLGPLGTLPNRVLNAKARDVLESFGVSGIDPRSEAGGLGVSEQQVVEIVKVLARNPRVVVLDEPTAGLSEDRVEWLLGLMRRMANEQKIVIFISHRMNEVRSVADRVTVFRNGASVGVRMMKETSSDELVSLMLGREVTDYFPKKEGHVRPEVILETRGLAVASQLSDINLTLHEGEVLGLGGLVGQGQTPLFLSLFGIIRSVGSIFVRGRRRAIRNPRAAIANGIALIPEDKSTQGLVMSMAIRENITLPILGSVKKNGFISRRRERDVVAELMNVLKIKAQTMESRVGTLSGGNQQKVVIAKLMSTSPRVLLMYDPTRGVDVGTKTEIFHLVRDLARDGHGVLLYSTTTDELVHVCDRVLVMYDGKITAELDGERLTKENIVRASLGETVA
jgi:ribose transport system ATP-binding protein